MIFARLSKFPMNMYICVSSQMDHCIWNTGDGPHCAVLVHYRTLQKGMLDLKVIPTTAVVAEANEAAGDAGLVNFLAEVSHDFYSTACLIPSWFVRKWTLMS